MMRRRALLAASQTGGGGKKINMISIRRVGKAFAGLYQYNFTAEYPVATTIFIRLSNGNPVSIHQNKTDNFTYAAIDISFLGLAFTYDSLSWESEIEDDTYVYQYQIVEE